MRTIKWVLPFATKDYLLQMTQELCDNPFVKLITGLENNQGGVSEAYITIEETENIEEVILYIGATIGAHSVTYAMDILQNIEQTAQVTCKCGKQTVCEEEAPEVIYLPEKLPRPEQNNQEIEIETQEDLFQEQTLTVEAQELLRGVLSRFKSN